jgi:hypothetical protein
LKRWSFEEETKIEALDCKMTHNIMDTSKEEEGRSKLCDVYINSCLTEVEKP